jgi:choline dehydrogenase
MPQNTTREAQHQSLQDRLEHALIAGRISRRGFLRAAAAAGLAGSSLHALADELDAIRANQAERAKTLQAAYDFIVVGTGCAGSALVGRWPSHGLTPASWCSRLATGIRLPR